MNVRMKIMNLSLLHVWLYGVELTICKLKKRHIIQIAVNNWVKTGYLNAKTHNDKEYRDH